MRVIGLDYGSKTCGVAISDDQKLIASPRETIFYKDNDDLFEKLDNYFNEYKIEEIVLGNPKNLDGSLSDRSKNTLLFKEELEKRYNLNVIFEDERYTSVIANNLLIEGSTRRKDRKKVVDKMAASIILQGYLDRRGNGR